MILEGILGTVVAILVGIEVIEKIFSDDDDDDFDFDFDDWDDG